MAFARKPPGASLLRTADRAAVRLLMFTGVGISMLGAGVYALLAPPLAHGVREVIVAGCVVLAAVFVLSGRFAGRGGLGRASRIGGWSAIVWIVALAVLLGQGVQAPVLGLLGVIVCTASFSASLGVGLAMAVCSVLALIGLAAAQATGWLSTPPPASPQAALLLHFVTWSLVIVTGLATGALITRATAGVIGQSREREARFHSLLRLAADWYWEMDDQYRFTHLAEDWSSGSGLPAEHRIGFAPWDIPQFGLGSDAMDAHRSDLELRRAFSGVTVRRRDAQGRLRIARVSGEPRYDARGVFRGYWGVGRDVTAEVDAWRAINASETRYRELFQRAPSPLVLHRFGTVIDANPAALALFGYATLDALRGRDLGSHYDGQEARERAGERIARLEALRVGDGVETQAFRLRAADGGLRWVHDSAVRVDAAGGPATLSIFHDETDQVEADAATRRSETMLSHLVATSPDVITLTELASGRYLRVNESFERLSGYAASEVIGRSAVEIGIWQDDADRRALVAAIARDGGVDGWLASFVNRRGEVVQMLLSAARFTLDGLDYLVLNGRDVTQSERQRLERQAMLDHAAIGIAFARDGSFVQANASWDAMFGWPAGALAGRTMTAVWPDAAQHDDALGAAMPRLLTGGLFEAEQTMRRRDGSLFPCRIRAQVVDPQHPVTGGTIWIAEDITERRRAEQALADARDAALAANRAKSAFLANMSHEMRTPLNGLLGLAGLAMQAETDEARRRLYLRQIHESAQSLSDIIADILDLSKIEAGKLTLESVPFDLHALLDTLVRAYRSLAEARTLRLTLQIGPGVPRHVRGDPLRTRQILANYLTNALKFTEHGGIQLAVERVAGRLRFCVTDTGPGIAAATLARLFQPFTQADESTTRRFGGTGLGLSICRELAELMGGQVGVDSRPGEGSRFWAELPLPEAETAPAATPPADQHALAGARLLMVEDNPVNMMIAVAMLEQWGVQVDQAEDGQAAVDAAVQASTAGQPFDAVLMDVQMPVMSGHEAARALRARPETADVPIVALTAAALVSERDAALAAGMNDFLTKPIDAERLRTVLARWVGPRPG